jgi:hypothetical protein
MEIKLDQPLTIGVGGNGIIGRRVTLWMDNDMRCIAEGVIGFN